MTWRAASARSYSEDMSPEKARMMTTGILSAFSPTEPRRSAPRGLSKEDVLSVRVHGRASRRVVTLCAQCTCTRSPHPPSGPDTAS